MKVGAIEHKLTEIRMRLTEPGVSAGEVAAIAMIVAKAHVEVLRVPRKFKGSRTGGGT